MILLRCGCKVTNEGNLPKVLACCGHHEERPYTPSDWKGFKSKRGPGDHETEACNWMQRYDYPD